MMTMMVMTHLPHTDEDSSGTLQQHSGLCTQPYSGWSLDRRVGGHGELGQHGWQCTKLTPVIQEVRVRPGTHHQWPASWTWARQPPCQCFPEEQQVRHSANQVSKHSANGV